MITDAQFDRWLRTSGVPRCVLVELPGDTPIYLSSRAYVTAPDDQVAPNRAYRAILQGGASFSESLSEDGAQARMSAGDIEIDNTGGHADDLLSVVWQDRRIEVYIGDVSWPRADYRLALAGVVARLQPRNARTLNLVLRDVLERLNNPANDGTLGVGPNAEQPMPLCMGECHNVTPRVEDTAGEQVRVHSRPIERIIELRDRGVPADATADLTNARATVAKQPDGLLTMSVQGDKSGGVYRNTVGPLVELLATSYGPEAERLGAGEIDRANFDAFAAAHPQPVGLYSAERITVRDAVQRLAASVGAQVAASRTGQLRLLKADPPPPTATAGLRVIRPGDYLDGSLRLAGFRGRVDGVTLGYCRNWTPGQEIAEIVPARYRDRYAQEWLTVTVGDASRAGEQIDTLLLKQSDALTEGQRRLANGDGRIARLALTGFAQLLQFELGERVVLYGNRYGLEAGRACQIVSLQRDWFKATVAVEVEVRL
ncbi:hypothetical protein FOZ76_14470 [Verticiella sediminum]|uniref:Phage tail protein n=1 Tax=Verticiella sediminum TaxID=1247510 RepID=A0A556AIB2_9BURK|nr:hypothetical protein [Verticiella sediminum]TSH92623.1 hypothetical protein FOZ76_14470 [Verticiella sediminum]